MKAIDSIGFNLVEADGRFTAVDGLNRLIIARGSAREARLGIDKARRRALIPEESACYLITQMTSGLKQLNSLIGYRRQGVSRYEIHEMRVDARENDFDS